MVIVHNNFPVFAYIFRKCLATQCLISGRTILACPNRISSWSFWYSDDRFYCWYSERILPLPPLKYMSSCWDIFLHLSFSLWLIFEYFLFGCRVNSACSDVRKYFQIVKKTYLYGFWMIPSSWRNHKTKYNNTIKYDLI